MTRSSKRHFVTAVFFVLAGQLGTDAICAQQLDFLSAAVEEWVVVKDRPNGGDRPRITNEEDGIGVLTGASSILYQPSLSVLGEFQLTATFRQFDPQGRNEGFGLLFGGQSLSSSAQQRYSYFLIRQDGSALLKVREGARTRIVRDWLPVDELRDWDSRLPNRTFVANTLKVEATGETVGFTINDVDVWQVPRGDLYVDGIVGVRVNHGVRIQITQMTARSSTY